MKSRHLIDGPICVITLLKWQNNYFTRQLNSIRCLHHINDQQKHSWSILNHLRQKDFTTSHKKFACLLLNVSANSFGNFEKYRYLWDQAKLKIAVDGSANILAEKKLIHTADIVCGDFDSINPDLVQHLRCPTAKEKLNLLRENNKSNQPIEHLHKIALPQLIETPCQKETDFTKAIRVAINKKPETEHFFALYQSDGSRIDHLFGLINTLHIFKKNIILLKLDTNSVSWLLNKGHHIIEKAPGRALCSLVPFTGPAEVETMGLEYNSKANNPLNFGGTISTSNVTLANCNQITVKTNKEVLWTIDLCA